MMKIQVMSNMNEIWTKLGNIYPCSIVTKLKFTYSTNMCIVQSGNKDQ